MTQSALGVFILVLAVSVFTLTNSVRVFGLRGLAAGHSERQLAHLKRLRGGLRFLALMLVLGSVGVWGLYRVEDSRARAVWRKQLTPVYDPAKLWEAPDARLAELDPKAELIAYGRDLIAYTQDYYGPNGLVRPNSINALNCQSCHLDAGTKPFGNNYFAVASTYPKLRARSGAIESIHKRVNDCFERSLNGQAIDTTGREMEAIVAYIQYLGSGIPKGASPRGTGLVELPFMQRAADPAQGKAVFTAKCAACHGADGQGLPMPGSSRFYPPLWGPNSFNEAAGLFRLSRLAGYVKANMPFGATHQAPQLSDEEAWDVAAFINAQPRPKHPYLKQDWPNIAKKPFDHPFGPYKDTFPEIQHKFGPFAAIAAFYKK